MKQEYLLSPVNKQKYNKWLFSIIASEYDVVDKLLSFGMDRFWKRELIEMLPLLKKPIVVDCACGTGDIALMVSKMFADAKVVGVDITEKMLKIFKKKIKSERISMIAADVCNLPVSDGCCDLVTGGYVLRNAPDLARYISAVYSVLKPGGCAVFLDFSRYTNPVLSRIQFVLLYLWGGFWGAILHGNPRIYGYIADSLMVYPDVYALEKQFLSSGFESVVTKRYLFGMMAIVLCRKKKETGNHDFPFKN